MESLRDGCDAAKGIEVGCENQLLNFEGLERDERVVMMRQVDRKKSIRRHQTIAWMHFLFLSLSHCCSPPSPSILFVFAAASFYWLNTRTVPFSVVLSPSLFIPSFHSNLQSLFYFIILDLLYTVSLDRLLYKQHLTSYPPPTSLLALCSLIVYVETSFEYMRSPLLL